MTLPIEIIDTDQFDPEFEDVESYIDYLEQTLIPDCDEEHLETGRDFKEAVYWLKKLMEQSC